MYRISRSALFAILAGLALVVTIAGPGQAAGAPFQIWGATQISGGLPSDVPADTHCTLSDSRDIAHPAIGCFVEYGDHIYVKDISGDGHSAMVYYTISGGGGDAACVNTGGSGTTARCDLGAWIPEGRTICIYQGWIEMGAGPDQFKYYIGTYSKVCFVNNN